MTSVDVFKGTLGFEDGTTASADLIIAADGIHVSILIIYTMNNSSSCRLSFAVQHPTTHRQQQQVLPQSLYRSRLHTLHNPKEDGCRRSCCFTRHKQRFPHVLMERRGQADHRVRSRLRPAVQLQLYAPSRALQQGDIRWRQRQCRRNW